MIWLYVAVGGAAGAVARYGLGGWIQDRTGFGFPWGTMVENLLGCLLIGFSIRYLEAIRLPAELRALVGVGVLGAFTTFSTFSYETVGLLEEGAWGRAAAYSLGSLLLGIVAVYLGVSISRSLLHLRL